MHYRIVITGLVIVHLAATLWHGDAHTRLAIELSAEKNLFVYIVILIAPLMAPGLVWTRYATIGLWVFVLSMVGSLLFGIYHHYALISPDNVGHLPAGTPESHFQFIASAAVIALLELASAVYGALRLRSSYAKPRAHFK
jgi:hypothetical protein